MAPAALLSIADQPIQRGGDGALAVGHDLETDDIEAEVQRLEALGATRYDHQQERGRVCKVTPATARLLRWSPDPGWAADP
jgi:hypothetical protein